MSIKQGPCLERNGIEVTYDESEAGTTRQFVHHRRALHSSSNRSCRLMLCFILTMINNLKLTELVSANGRKHARWRERNRVVNWKLNGSQLMTQIFRLAQCSMLNASWERMALAIKIVWFGNQFFHSSEFIFLFMLKRLHWVSLLYDRVRLRQRHWSIFDGFDGFSLFRFLRNFSSSFFGLKYKSLMEINVNNFFNGFDFKKLKGRRHSEGKVLNVCTLSTLEPSWLKLKSI